MTVTYPNGKVLQTIVLSHEEDVIHAIAPSEDDVLVFSRSHGTWISEDREQVTIEFEWQRRDASPLYRDDNFICPKGLAARLIAALLRGGDQDEAAANTFLVFSPLGTRVAFQVTEQQPN
jgi:hypothetical protein